MTQVTLAFRQPKLSKSSVNNHVFCSCEGAVSLLFVSIVASVHQHTYIMSEVPRVFNEKITIEKYSIDYGCFHVFPGC